MNRHFFMFLAVLFFSFSFLVAQSQRDLANSKIDDAITELETGNLRLYFFNALDGKPVEKANVSLKGLGDFQTDNQGKIEFSPIEENYLQRIRFEKKGFISADFEVEIMLKTIIFNRISVSPVMDLKHFRIVLDWDKQPRDLDAHFVKKDEYHISYHHMKTLSDGSGRLDRDDMDGYGPETITVHQIEKNGVYEFYVHDYTNRNHRNSKALSNSNATVRVYGRGQLLKVFKISSDQAGRTWNVFRIENSEIIPINIVQ